MKEERSERRKTNAIHENIDPEVKEKETNENEGSLTTDNMEFFRFTALIVDNGLPLFSSIVQLVLSTENEKRCEERVMQ